MHKKRERIAIVSNSFPPLGGGGVTSSHFNLLLALKKKGFIVHGFTFGDWGHEQIVKEAEITRGGLPIFLVKLINRVVSVFLKLSGERGNLFQLSDALTGALAGIFLFKKIKEFNPDIVVLPDHGAPGALMPKLKGSKTILISHHNPMRFLDEPLFGIHSRRDSTLALSLESLAISKVDGVICPSIYMKEIFTQTYSFRRPVEVIPNMLDADMIQNIPVASLCEKMGLSKDAPIVYIPSADSVYKGSQFVFEIIRRLASEYPQEIGFYLTGNIGIELERSLEFLPSNASLLKPGKISYKDNIANIKSCKFCVSPTLIESFGMAILESQICGLPVVTFDVGGNRAVVKDGETGYIVPFIDVEKLISLSQKMLFDKDLLGKLSSNAFAYTKQTFNEDLIVGKFIRFCSNL